MVLYMICFALTLKQKKTMNAHSIWVAHLKKNTPAVAILVCKAIATDIDLTLVKVKTFIKLVK